MRSLLTLAICLILLSAPVQAATVLIHNGLAPPAPANVIDDATHAADNVWIRNADCPPGWPEANVSDACPAPGAPTAVAVDSGASVLRLDVLDSSSAHLSGGTVSSIVRTRSTASVMMSGGTVLDTIHTLNASRFTWTGGSIGGGLEAHETSVITVVGGDFRVDGAPVPYGDLSAQTGTLTGTLASGEPVDNAFFQGGGSWQGTVTLVEPAAVPVPVLSLWARFGLAGAIWCAVAVSRRAGQASA